MRDTSGQDRVLAKSNNKKAFWTKVAVGCSVVIAATIFVIPKMNTLFAAQQMVPMESLRFATVVRGDLQRDIAVQGRVVAANSPTLYAKSAGIVSLFVKAGEQVEQGQALAQIESPQLQSRYDQELSTLEQLKLEVGRHEIEIKTTNLINKQAVEMSAVNARSCAH